MNKKLVVVAVMLSVLLIMPATSYQTSMADNFHSEEKDGVASDGNTLYVGGSGPNNYTKIQDAIDDASDGDKIFVYNGTYYGGLIINKTVSLIGESRNNTIIDAQKKFTIMTLTADGINVKNFTLKNAGFNIAGIKIFSQNNQICCCDINSGYPRIYIENSNNSISNCAIRNAGIGIYIGGDYNKVSNCIFYDTGEGIHIYSSFNEVKECNFEVNGESIIIEESFNTVHRCTFSKNGWGIYIKKSSYNHLFDNDINKCHTGIKLSNSWNNNIDGCSFSKSDFGVCLEYSINNDISGCNFSGNNVGLYIRYKSHNNNVSHCHMWGKDYSTGVAISESDGNKILKCEICYHEMGIYLEWSNGSKIHFNNIFQNDKCGLWGHLSNANARYNYWGSPLGPSVTNHSFRGDKIIAEEKSRIKTFPWKILPVFILIGPAMATDETINYASLINEKKNTLYVGGSGPNNYTKIQDAIDDADDGDKIFVYSGVYTETVTVSKSIVLAGENRYNTAISENGTVLKVACDEVTIKNFFIKSDSRNYDNSSVLINGDYAVVEKNIISDSRCTGISLKSSSYCKISGNIIKNNSYDGISITEESNSNNISNNDIESGMSGVYVDSSNHQTISHNKITHFSKGIYLTECSDNTVASNDITNNVEGIFSYYATNNKIHCNNFISNENNARFAKFFHLGFLAPDIWRENYWDDWMGVGAKFIFGAIYVQTFGFIGLFIPWVEIDWHPAEEPYEWWKE